MTVKNSWVKCREGSNKGRMGQLELLKEKKTYCRKKDKFMEEWNNGAQCREERNTLVKCRREWNTQAK